MGIFCSTYDFSCRITIKFQYVFLKSIRIFSVLWFYFLYPCIFFVEKIKCIVKSGSHFYRRAMYGQTEKCKSFFRNYTGQLWLFKSFLQLENAREFGRNILTLCEINSWKHHLWTTWGVCKGLLITVSGKIYGEWKYIVHRDFFRFHRVKEFMWKRGQ